MTNDNFDQVELGAIEEMLQLKNEAIGATEELPDKKHSDNNNAKSEELAASDTDNNSQAELNDFEKEQQLHGWDPNGPKTAEEWAADKPLYQALQKKNKETQRLKRTVENMKKFMELNEKMAYERGVAEAIRERDEAERRGDIASAQRIDAEIEKMEPRQITPQIPDCYYDFIESNPWMTGNSYKEMEMQEFARKRDSFLENSIKDPEERIRVVEADVRDKFSDFFGIVKKPQSQTIETGQGVGASQYKTTKTKYTMSDLNSVQRKIVHDFELSGIISENGVMTREMYIQKLAEAGELENAR